MKDTIKDGHVPPLTSYLTRQFAGKKLYLALSGTVFLVFHPISPRNAAAECGTSNAGTRRSL